MPDFPIVDAHVHLWDPQQFRMNWLDNNETLGKPFGIPEFARHTVGVEVAAFVYVEVDVAPHYSLLEARWAVERAREDPRLSAVVAHAPLEYGLQVRSYLKELTSIGPLIKGIRRIVQGEKADDFCLQPRFVEGTKLLSDFGLTCDVCIRHSQLAATVELVKQCPKVNFMLDHIGKPDIKNQKFDPWRAQLKELANLSNVVCKVSGLVTEADWKDWKPADLKPYVEHVLASFGEERVIFGGDWPVALLASEYPRWVRTLDELTANLSTAAKRKLWTENARRFYHF